MNPLMSVYTAQHHFCGESLSFGQKWKKESCEWEQGSELGIVNSQMATSRTEKVIKQFSAPHSFLK